MRQFFSLLLPRNWGRLGLAVFGNVNYQPPRWLVASSTTVFDSMRRRPGVWALLITLTGSAVVGTKVGFDWWDNHKPRPKTIVEVREITGRLYGGNVEGIGAASILWCGKPASELTAREAVSLSVLPQPDATPTETEG